MVDLQFFVVDRPLCSFSMKDADNLGEGQSRRKNGLSLQKVANLLQKLCIHLKN